MEAQKAPLTFPDSQHCFATAPSAVESLSASWMSGVGVTTDTSTVGVPLVPCSRSMYIPGVSATLLAGTASQDSDPAALARPTTAATFAAPSVLARLPSAAG